MARYSRVVLKISGEAFGSAASESLDIAAIECIAGQIAKTAASGTQIAVVPGGGNIVRGNRLGEHGVNRATADYMGMLATVVNALSLQDALERLGAETRVQTAIEMREVAEPFIRRRCIRHLEKGRVVILGAGTGNPHFTTDTAAALRAREIEADAVLKGTNVDGVYSDNPAENPDATRFDTLSYEDVLRRDLRVMDATAITLLREAKIPIVVFDIHQEGNIEKAVQGDVVGTLIVARAGASPPSTASG